MINMCRPDAAFRLVVCELPSRPGEGKTREGHGAGWVGPGGVSLTR